jgi:hypothetical protein
MAKPKLTEAEKLEQKRIASEKQKADNLVSRLRDQREKNLNDPTIVYKVGDRVTYGAHPNAEILEVVDGGKIYLVKMWGNYQRYTMTVYGENVDYLSWIDLTPYRSYEENYSLENISTREERIVYQQRDVSGILNTYYHFGVDTSPDYQRGNVWTDEDKVLLIDSIFKNVDIGKFVFIHLGYGERKGYEILDGKQRLNALVEFFENRFPYKGKYFYDLSWSDQSHFEGYPISYAEMRNLTQKQKYAYFLKLNVAGHAQDPEHIKFVQELYERSI